MNQDKLIEKLLNEDWGEEDFDDLDLDDMEDEYSDDDEFVDDEGEDGEESEDSSTDSAISKLKEAIELVQKAAEVVDEAKLEVKKFEDDIGGDIMEILDDDIANVLAIGKDSVKARIQSVIDKIHEHGEKEQGLS